MQCSLLQMLKLQMMNNMEKIYKLSEESKHFNDLNKIYLDFHQKSDVTIQISQSKLDLDCYELLKFAVHHAECGENVYILNFPKIIPVPNRPDTLFFLEKWGDLLDISDLEHALALAVYNRNTFTPELNLNKIYSHIQERFKSFIIIEVGV